jgi:predicted thioesterase
MSLLAEHVLHEQAGPLVVRVGVEHLAQAPLGADVVALVLVEHREVQQRVRTGAGAVLDSIRS